jgi:putative endonuclease
MSDRSFFCYILECADGTYYTGWTSNPNRRLKQHNRGAGSRYTRARLPVKLVYLEELPDRSTAMKRERIIKNMHRLTKSRLITIGAKARMIKKTGPS